MCIRDSSMRLHLQNRFEFGDRLWKWKRKETDVNDNDNEEVKTNGKEEETKNAPWPSDRRNRTTRPSSTGRPWWWCRRPFFCAVLVFFFLFCLYSKTYTLNMWWVSLSLFLFLSSARKQRIERTSFIKQHISSLYIYTWSSNCLNKVVCAMCSSIV